MGRGGEEGRKWVFYRSLRNFLGRGLSQQLMRSLTNLNLLMEIFSFTLALLLEDIPDHDALVATSTELLGPAGWTSRHVC